MRVLEADQTETDWQQWQYGAIFTIVVASLPDGASVTLQISADGGTTHVVDKVWEISEAFNFRFSPDLWYRLVASQAGAVVDVVGVS